MTIRPPDPMALAPLSYVAHLYGRSVRSIREWVHRYGLTRLTRKGARARVGTRGYWLSLREIADKVPEPIRERAGAKDPLNVTQPTPTNQRQTP